MNMNNEEPSIAELVERARAARDERNKEHIPAGVIEDLDKAYDEWLAETVKEANLRKELAEGERYDALAASIRKLDATVQQRKDAINISWRSVYADPVAAAAKYDKYRAEKGEKKAQQMLAASPARFGDLTPECKASHQETKKRVSTLGRSMKETGATLAQLKTLRAKLLAEQKKRKPVNREKTAAALEETQETRKKKASIIKELAYMVGEAVDYRTTAMFKRYGAPGAAMAKAVKTVQEGRKHLEAGMSR